MLETLDAQHDYGRDQIQVRNRARTAILTNQIDQPYYTKLASLGLPLTLDWKQHKPKPEQVTHTGSKDKAQPIMPIEDTAGQPEPGAQWTEIPTEQLGTKGDIFTRLTEPFSTKRVDAIWKVVKLGEDLSDAEKKQVRDLISTYADCFALSVREVVPAMDATLSLNIPMDAQLPMKARQQTFTPPQRRYLHKKILEMLKAGIIEHANPAQIKCVSSTTLG